MGNFVLYRNGKRTDITGSIEKISQYVDATQLALKHRRQRIYKHESVFSNEIPIKKQSRRCCLRIQNDGGGVAGRTKHIF